MVTAFHTLSRRCQATAALLLLAAAVSGCSLWDKDRWNLDGLRDEQAVDIERRLDRREPIVKNPF